MATLPTPGGDAGTWGTELNEWNLVSHAADGTIQTDEPAYIGGEVFDSVPQLAVRDTYTALENPAGNKNVLRIEATAKGARDSSHMLYNTQSMVADAAGVNQVTVTGAVNNGSGLIRLTATSHGYTTGDRIIAESIGGVPNAQGSWIVTVINANTLDLQGSTWGGAFTSGGFVTNRAGYHAYLALVTVDVDRSGLTGVNQYADDVSGYFISNNGEGIATDPFYLGHRAASSGPEWWTAGSYDGATTFGLCVNNVLTGPVLRGTIYATSDGATVAGRRARGTFDAPRRALASDVLASFTGVGGAAADDATTAVFGNATARIDMYADQNHTASAQGTSIRFYTTTFSGTSIAERLRVAPGDGIDFHSSTVSNYMIRLKNNAVVQGMNNAGAAGVNLFKINTSDQFEITGGTIKATATTLGFYGGTAGTKPTVTGSRAGNAALADLLTELAGIGLITDSSSA